MDIHIKRGRPKKIINEINIENPNQVKRGRPKKIIDEINIENPNQVKRGRPKKIIDEINIENPTQVKRGRPKKILNKPNIESPIQVKRGRPKKIIDETKKEIPKKIIDETKKDNSKQELKIAKSIKDRINNYYILKELIKNNSDNILKIDKKKENITIGKINIIKQIGSKSKNGIVLLGEIDGFKLSLKITKFNPKNTNELDTLKETTKVVIDNKTQHLPLLYGYNIFQNMDNYYEFPNIFHKFLKGKYIIYYNELADGDLKTFLNENYNNDELIINTLKQLLKTLVDFYKYIGKFHYDSHSGNFLYHKINNDYLFVLWDFEKSNELSKNNIYRVNIDIEKLLFEFFNEDDKIKGFMSSSKPYGKKVKIFVMDLYKTLISDNKAKYFELGFSKEKLNELILKIEQFIH